MYVEPGAFRTLMKVKVFFKSDFFLWKHHITKVLLAEISSTPQLQTKQLKSQCNGEWSFNRVGGVNLGGDKEEVLLAVEGALLIAHCSFNKYSFLKICLNFRYLWRWT